MSRMRIIWSTIFLFENQDPENPASKAPSFLTTSLTASIAFLTSFEGTSRSTG